MQDAHSARLLALSQRKADVESQIIRHVRELAEAFEVVLEEFEAVVQGRAKDVYEAITAMNESNERSNPQ
jgi:hypothetical protein